MSRTFYNGVLNAQINDAANYMNDREHAIELYVVESLVNVDTIKSIYNNTN